MLVDRLIKEAEAAGHGRMRLDTSVRQNEAIRLHAAAGFRRILPYYDLPGGLRNWLVYFERELQSY